MRGIARRVTVALVPIAIFLLPVASAEAAALDLGGPGPSAQPVPLVLDLSQLEGACDVPDVTIGSECAFWHDGGAFSTRDVNAGWADLDRWGVAPNSDCPAASLAARSDHILNDFPESLGLADPGPTSACNTPGSASASFEDLAARVGARLVLPVTDCAQQVDENGDVVSCGSGVPHKFAVVGFTSLRLDAVLRGNDPAAIGTPGTLETPGTPGACGIRAADPNAICLVMIWQGPTQMLSVRVRGTGSGSVMSQPAGIDCETKCHAIFDRDLDVTLTAEPAADSTFVRWAGACTGSGGTCKVTLNQALSVTAKFRAIHLPDAQIAIGRSGPWIGRDVYSSSGVGQGLVQSLSHGSPTRAFVRVQNDGSRPDSFRLRGPTSASGYSIRYFVGHTEITSAVAARTYVTATLRPGAHARVVTVKVRVRSWVATGSTANWTVGWSSLGWRTRVDRVGLGVEVVEGGAPGRI